MVNLRVKTRLDAPRWLLAVIVVLHVQNTYAASTTPGTVRVIDEVTMQPISDAFVIVEGKHFSVDAKGNAAVEYDRERVALSIGYRDGKLRRIETYHDFPAEREVVLRVPNAQGVRREAVFSVGVPFGPIQKQAHALVLLPQPAYETGGLNFGHFDRVRLYQDQLQDDGRFSLLVVALNEKLIPWKYGYMLDVAPDKLDEAHLSFKPPLATDIDREPLLLRWRKEPDAVGKSDPNTPCDFKTPPLTECGHYPDKGGIFSWMNVWRKGQLFHTPGAFLPARTAGANPLLALPDGQIELVGHDDPLGFSPFNYARHRYLRYNTAPTEVVSILMPNVIIGAADKPGSEAIIVSAPGASSLAGTASYGARFVIQPVGALMEDSANLDWGKVQFIWIDKQEGARTIWNQYFSPKNGENNVLLNTPPKPLVNWLPPSTEQEFENVQVWLYGSTAVNGYRDALTAFRAGTHPLRLGSNAFQVTRWR